MFEEILEELAAKVIEYDKEGAVKTAKKALESGIDPVVAIQQGLAKGIKIVGEKFECNEVFLPHLVMASDAMMAAVKEIEPSIPRESLNKIRTGTVVMGTVRGDIHDIGKNIVATMLRAGSFEVNDLGHDIQQRKFIEEAENSQANIIAMSSLLTTSMMEQKELIEDLNKKNLRTKYIVMVGGGPVNQQWAEDIGADGYGRDAKDALEKAKQLMQR
jgi:corrinoid protein of di/trimethylamine methyltransferase